MGRPADENLPEVAPYQPGQSPHAFDHAPEVASPYDAAHQHYFSQHEKYPAIYDNSPKLPYDPNDATMNGQQWPTPAPVSALSPNSAMPWDSLPAGQENMVDPSSVPAAQGKRICGLRRRIFIIIAVVLVVVIAAGVGGGVGATVNSGSDSGTSSPAETESSRSPIPSALTTSERANSVSTTSTTSAALPSSTVEFLNNQTGLMGLAFQGFEKQDYLGRDTTVIREEGFHELDFEVKSYVWLPNGTDCCVTFCLNETESAGWRCDSRYRPETDDGSGFPRINIWCGRANSRKYSKLCS